MQARKHIAGRYAVRLLVSLIKSFPPAAIALPRGKGEGGVVTRVITVADAHLRPVRVMRSAGHPTVVRYSTAFPPRYVLRQAIPELSNEEALELASQLKLSLEAQ